MTLVALYLHSAWSECLSWGGHTLGIRVPTPPGETCPLASLPVSEGTSDRFGSVDRNAALENVMRYAGHFDGSFFIEMLGEGGWNAVRSRI